MKRQVVAFERRNDIMIDQVNIIRQSSRIEYNDAHVWELVLSIDLEDEIYAYLAFNYLCKNHFEVCILFEMPPYLRTIMTEA